MPRLVAGGLDPLWRRLTGPWLPAVGGVLGLGLALAARQLPQLPGQLLDEPATAARWMQDASAAYGVWGNLGLALGLFDVLHSPLLYLALALTLPALAAQLAESLGKLRQGALVLRTVAAAPPTSAGEPLALPVGAARRRLVVDRPIDQVVETARQADLPPLHLQPVAVASTQPADANDDPPGEVRLSGARRPFVAWLRPLLPLGLLVAVLALWSALLWGWQVAAPPLAPGSTYRVLGQQLAIGYVASLTPTVPSRLQVNLRGDELALPVDRARREQVSGATLSVRPAYPALWVASADGTAQLSLPGRADAVPALGIVFDGSTTEESVLLPAVGAGLRVVRRLLPEPGFVLELYRSDEVQPIYRAELPANGRVVIPLPRTNLELIVTTLPGLLVNVHYLPNLWVAWLGLALALVGGAAHRSRAGWAAVQVAPWAPGRTVVVVQTSDPRWADGLAARLAAPAAPAPDA